jgi:hypothetical protein
MNCHVVVLSYIVKYINYLFILPNDEFPKNLISHAEVVVKVFDRLLTVALDRWLCADLFHHPVKVPFLFEESIRREEGKYIVGRLIPMFQFEHIDMSSIWITDRNGQVDRLFAFADDIVRVAS